MNIQGFEVVEHGGQFFDAFQTDRAVFQYLPEFRQFGFVVALQVQDGLEFGYRLLANAFVPQFRIDVVQTDFVHLVDGNGDIRQLFRVSDVLGDARQDFPVIEQQTHTDIQTAVHFVHDLNQFHFVQQGVAADHIHVALVKLPVTSLLWPVGAPHRLNLIAFERKGQLVLVLYHEPGERHGQVVSQSFFGNPIGQFQAVFFKQLVFRYVSDEISGVQNLEQQFVAFVPVFAHQGGQILHRRSL